MPLAVKGLALLGLHLRPEVSNLVGILVGVRVGAGTELDAILLCKPPERAFGIGLHLFPYRHQPPDISRQREPSLFELLRLGRAKNLLEAFVGLSLVGDFLKLSY